MGARLQFGHLTRKRMSPSHVLSLCLDLPFSLPENKWVGRMLKPEQLFSVCCMRCTYDICMLFAYYVSEGVLRGTSSPENDVKVWAVMNGMSQAIKSVIAFHHALLNSTFRGSNSAASFTLSDGPVCWLADSLAFSHWFIDSQAPHRVPGLSVRDFRFVSLDLHLQLQILLVLCILMGRVLVGSDIIIFFCSRGFV